MRAGRLAALGRAPRGPRVVHLVFAALAVSLLVLTMVTAGASALPEGRAYELVSPAYKGGYGVLSTAALAPDGESAAFISQGAFDGTLDNNLFNDYLVRRSDTGWSTTELEPPASLAQPDGLFAHQMSFSPSLEYALVNSTLGSSGGNANSASTQGAFLATPLAPGKGTAWRRIGPNEGVLESLSGPIGHVEQKDFSATFCHVIVDPLNVALLPEAERKGAIDGELYDMSQGCHGETPYLRLMDVKNENGPHGEPELINFSCEMSLGAFFGLNGGGKESDSGAVSADGSAIFVTANVEDKPGVRPDCSNGDSQLFVRLGGERTVEVSKPLGEACKKVGEIPCEPGAGTRPRAFYQGASEDGSRVFFTTAAKLVGEDHDEKSNLYMSSIGCPPSSPECSASEREVLSLVQVSHSSVTGEAAEVMSTVSITPDGTHVYYVATGVLSEGANPEGRRPLKGADNLYLYERDSRFPAGHTVFVADLCSASGVSGTITDPNCPQEMQGTDATLWGSGVPLAQTAADGGILVFDSYARLVVRGPQADTDNAQDVYRYDAETGRLERVSVGEDGYDTNGNRGSSSQHNSDALIGQAEPNHRSVNEDGSRIIFESSEPLSSISTNDLNNVYEWHDGAVSLVSSGSSPQGDCCATMTPSGDDVLFTTTQGLVSEDTDGLADIYDARLPHGPGEPVAFPEPADTPERCAPGECQGSVTAPAALLVPGSVSQAPGENVVPVKQVSPTKGAQKHKFKKRKVKRASRKGRGARKANRRRTL